MEPGVPFALLGSVQLLVVAACAALVALAVTTGRRPAAALVAAGAVLLAVVEVRTALRFGEPASSVLLGLRAGAAVLLAGGLLQGGLGAARRRRTDPSTPLLGVVVPLAATLPVAVVTAAATVVAAAAALRARRGPVSLLVAGGLLLWAAAAAFTTHAEHAASGAVAVLALRGAGALLVLGGAALAGRSSLLSKVTGAIIAGVLVMAVAAVGVVGSVVVTAYDQQSRSLVEQAAETRVQDLSTLGTQALGVANFADLLSQGGGNACTVPDAQAGGQCAAFLAKAASGQRGDFVVSVARGGRATLVVQRSAGLTPSELLGLGTAAPVSQLLEGGSDGTAGGAAVSSVRLRGKVPSVAEIAVVPHYRATGDRTPDRVLVYGIRLGPDFTGNFFQTGGYGLTVLAGEPLTASASTLSEDEQGQLERTVTSALAGRSLPADGTVLGSQGSRPTYFLEPVSDSDQQPVGLLVVSRTADSSLGAEQHALRLLLETALLTVLVVAAIALLLGRRTVEPVQRLTAAVRRFAAGEVVPRTDTGSRDEVGVLSRTFDAMTASLAEASDELRTSAARLGTVLASMSDGLLATDGQGVVTSVNPAALAMLGLEEHEVIGEHLQDTADVRDESGTQLADARLRLRDEPAQVHRPDGTTVPVRVAITPLEGADGVVLVLRDTTREREVERMKTEFLSNVSHELRTPLTPIRGYAEILVSRPGLDSAKVTSFATTIRDESLKMNRVVDLLVDVAALEAGRVHVVPAPTSVKDLLAARCAAWQTKAGERGGDLGLKVAARLPAVLVDPTWVGKALDELIDNALKYSPPGTPVTLFAVAAGEDVRVGVRDKGAGIAEADQPALFTSFEQVDGSATRRVGGLGLGLSFVQRVAEDQGFVVSVVSALGKGSEFALDLPATDLPVPRADKPKKLVRR